MSDFDPVEAGAEALWDEYRDHSEDPPWGDKELHARFKEAYRVKARAVLAAALDRDGLARVLYEVEDADRGAWDDGDTDPDWLADAYERADAIRAWAGATS